MAFTEKSRFVDWTQYDSFSLAETNTIMSNSYVISGFTIDATNNLQGGRAFVGGIDVELSGAQVVTPVEGQYLHLKTIITPGSQNALTGVTVPGSVLTTTLMNPSENVPDTANTKYLKIAKYQGGVWIDERVGRVDTVNGRPATVGTNNVAFDSSDIMVDYEGVTIPLQDAVDDIDAELTEGQLINTLQTDAIAILNNKLNALPMNASLRAVKTSASAVPTTSTDIDMYTNRQTVINYQPNYLDYKVTPPNVILMKAAGDYIFDFSLEATHTNATPTTITFECWVDGVLYDTVTRTLTGGATDVIGLLGIFTYSKADGSISTEISFKYRASQGNTSAHKAMININLSGANTGLSFTDTDHVTGSVDLDNPLYEGQSLTHIINDLDDNKVNVAGDTMTGPLVMDTAGNFFNNGTGSIEMSNSDIVGLNNVVFNDIADGLEGIQFLKSGTLAGSQTPEDYNVLYALDDDIYINDNKAVLSYPELAVGTDLNDLTKPGMYHSVSNADNCLNVPVDSTAFSLLVEKHAGVKQTWTTYLGTPTTYMRNYYSTSGWGPWEKVVFASNKVHKQIWSLDELDLDGTWSNTSVPANIKKAYDKVVSYIGYETAFTIVQALYLNSGDDHYEFTQAINDSLTYEYGQGMTTSVWEFSITFGLYNGVTNININNTNFIRVKSYGEEYTRIFRYDDWFGGGNYFWLDEKGAPHKDVMCDISQYMTTSQDLSLNVPHRGYISGITFTVGDYQSVDTAYSIGDIQVRCVPRAKSQTVLPGSNVTYEWDTLFTPQHSFLVSMVSVDPNPASLANIGQMYFSLKYGQSGDAYPDGISIHGGLDASNADVVLSNMVIHYGAKNWDISAECLYAVGKGAAIDTLHIEDNMDDVTLEEAVKAKTIVKKRVDK